MGVNMQRRFLVSLFAIFFVVNNAYSMTAYDLNWAEIEEDYLIENYPFSGQHYERNEWDSTFCRAHSEYTVQGQGTVKWVKMKPVSPKEVIITADLRDLYARVDATLRSSYTFCITTPAWLGASSSWGKLRGRLVFNGESLKNFTLTVEETELGRLGLGEFVPDWLADVATDLANRAFAEIWKTDAGAWMSEEIAKQLKKKIPNGSNQAE